MVIGVDFFLATLDNLTIDILIDWNSTFFVDGLGEIVALGVVVAIACAAVDFNPTFCRR